MWHFCFKYQLYLSLPQADDKKKTQESPKLPTFIEVNKMENKQLLTFRWL